MQDKRTSNEPQHDEDNYSSEESDEEEEEEDLELLINSQAEKLEDRQKKYGDQMGSGKKRNLLSHNRINHTGDKNSLDLYLNQGKITFANQVANTDEGSSGRR
mmetsp:Transcript_52423/g.59929  ORF Transcript_52423/g.59929 Transcript_52423/m.59929 type:complete len:103 (+) Transcript_52423:202-510(+)|eukprot:CAMPEP_0115009198 /NCGR_PEP_ID=MMETSP0216-20121206/22453_1 /TAXON_ID=223996 /ORGANISM="Protocruzia adherens, Strain Boccale" /LENGTH=102 /DNA_ID=CAMNT_0002376927 /DNA_START=195 /DNA_END=503 /DNA_ORIENTATION=+